MLQTGILNPHINSLLSRVRHTNLLVIADRGFPYWPMIETVDISLTDDIPRVLDVLRAIQRNFTIGACYVAEEFRTESSAAARMEFFDAMRHTPITFEPHAQFKQRVPRAIGLIRTADTTPYANMILESA
uniref:Putative cytoplasmic sugar-binding protein n=1 Tax=mine drainage metagenome TaxID=410659 RepID=E6PWZ5_9ZZZZ